MTKEKIKLTVLLTVFLLFIGTAGLWMFNSRQNNAEGNFTNLVLPLVLLLIIALLIPVIIRNARSVKKRMPVEDERSRKAGLKAGYYTFLFSIYFLLAIGWFGDDYFTRPSQATGLAILGLAIVFIFLWLFFNKWGKL